MQTYNNIKARSYNKDNNNTTKIEDEERQQRLDHKWRKNKQ